MADQTLCPRFRHANPPENRRGASLGAGRDLIARRESDLTIMGHTLPVKPGPVGKALTSPSLDQGRRGNVAGS